MKTISVKQAHLPLLIHTAVVEGNSKKKAVPRSSSSSSLKSPWYGDDLSKLYDSAPDALSYVLGFLSVRCPNLRSLSLPSHVEARHAAFMPTSIRELSLHYVLQSANFNALLPAIDERLPGLTTLRVIRSAIKADSIPLIPRGLLSLSLEGSPRLETVKGLPPGLKRLSLRSCNVLTADAFLSLPEGLEFLDVAYCRALTNTGLDNLPRRLRALVLSHNSQITDSGLRNLPPGLTEIKIKQCVGVSTGGVIGLPLRLRSLSLNGHFDRDLLLSLPFEELHHLTLSNISSVDDETLSAFLCSRAAQTLRSLSLRYCPVSDAGLAVLPSSLVSLTIFGASTGGVWNASHAKQTGVITDKTFRSLPSTIRHVRLKALPYVSSGTVHNLRQAGITVREG
jgi:hypothetical protein